MPSQDHAQYRVVLHRTDASTEMFAAPGYSVIIQAKDPEDAVRQAEQIAGQQEGHFEVVDVKPMGQLTGPAAG